MVLKSKIGKKQTKSISAKEMLFCSLNINTHLCHQQSLVQFFSSCSHHVTSLWLSWKATSTRAATAFVLFSSLYSVCCDGHAAYNP